MKYIKILSGCVVGGRNVSGGTLLELEKVAQFDRELLTGAGLAKEIELFPVEETKPTKKAKK